MNFGWPLLFTLTVFIIVFLVYRIIRIENQLMEIERREGFTVEQDEIQATLEQFVEEIKQENERLIKAISGIRQKNDLEIKKIQNEVHGIKKEIITLRKGTESEKYTKQRLFSDQLKLLERYEQIFQLKQMGLNSDEIAKRTGMGNGEISLILQLAKQEGLKM
ncbi:DUF2802 domain-containing protein [Microaerobacter geothermalis]|uniref:DUF2802 domain-containing protein n=1 Tax=Microaerobacter geothermalis TaxID=674972 RepID=UPI001F2DB090|nr:DUF2802 domain-containing protein [Microaerobacter geothermalis]MCF6093808.1 DUF2802 domain-containing protein [Microaerobacter geothermalis]